MRKMKNHIRSHIHKYIISNKIYLLLKKMVIVLPKPCYTSSRFLSFAKTRSDPNHTTKFPTNIIDRSACCFHAEKRSKQSKQKQNNRKCFKRVVTKNLK